MLIYVKGYQQKTAFWWGGYMGGDVFWYLRKQSELKFVAAIIAML